MKCIELLTQDHHTILRSLDVLQCMTERARIEPLQPKDAETLLHFFRTFADDYHHVREESGLFPEMRQASEAQGRPLDQLLFEHDQERSLLDGLEDSICTANKGDFILFASRLADRIRTHMYKEEHILFPIAAELLSPEQDLRVSTELAKCRLDPSLMTDLRRLENLYLRRTATG